MATFAHWNMMGKGKFYIYGNCFCLG